MHKVIKGSIGFSVLKHCETHAQHSYNLNEINSPNKTTLG